MRIADEIARALTSPELEGATWTIADDSRLHGKTESHFRIQVTSAGFAGMPLLARHRLLQRLLGALQGRVHSLSFDPVATDEQPAQRTATGCRSEYPSA